VRGTPRREQRIAEPKFLELVTETLGLLLRTEKISLRLNHRAPRAGGLEIREPGDGALEARRRAAHAIGVERGEHRVGLVAVLARQPGDPCAGLSRN
jgi:hypothetical protein